MTEADAETLAVYDAQAAEYAAKFATERASRRLMRFLDGLAPGARLLDLGCGIGDRAAQMRDAGFEVLALDPSEGMAAEAAARYGLDIHRGSFDDIPMLGRFDGVWAHFSLLHARRGDLPRHLGALHAALAPGGRLLVGMKTGHGTQRDRLGRRYCYVTEDELTDLLHGAGFVPREVETGTTEGLDGTLAPWIVITAHA